jgi:UDP-N-acetylmuramyl pentapeptide phosphotransferase/UDP-N-acetylglucosamine-1-phosphate transferase
MNASGLTLAGGLASTLVISHFGVRGMRYLAERHSILDIPNERSSHSKTVPRGGGVPIVLLTLIGLWLYAILTPAVDGRGLLAYTVGALLIAIISWLDDIRSQPNWLRFGIHSLAALLALYACGYLPVGKGSSDATAFEWLGSIVIFFWIVGLTNAYNFMDGIDGIAGTQAIVAGVAWAVLGWLTAHPFVMVFGLLLAGGSLGFLTHNWPPARIFMGDVGSAFLGYSFAILPLVFHSGPDRRAHWLGAIAIGILPVWPFVFDSTFTLLRRLSKGENVFSAHRSHLYQRLTIIGFSHSLVTLLYGGLAVFGALLLLGWELQAGISRLTVAAVLPLLCFSLWVYVTRCEVREAQRLATTGGNC